MVLGLAAALVVFGTFQIQKMPVDVFPEFEQPIVRVDLRAARRSAAGSMTTSHIGANQNIQRKPLVIPP